MGPLVLAPVLKPQRAFVWIEDANIHAAVPTTRERVDLWISANIHVPGRPEWIFVKVWGHSVESDAEVANNLAGGSSKRPSTGSRATTTTVASTRFTT